MKPITKLQPEDVKNLKLVCFDVDGVTIEKGTEIKEVETKETSTLTVKTHVLSDEVLKKMLLLKSKVIVAISSGRSSMYLTDVYAELLWTNAALISENGIFTLLNGELIQMERFDIETLRTIRNIYVDLKELENHKYFRAFEPKQFLITLHAYKEIKEVYKIVKKHDKQDKFYCWWNGEAFDIAPRHLNKGTGLKNLCKHLKIDLKDTMAIGNGINDKNMTDAAGIGVTTEPKVLKSDFYTTGAQHLGGVELIDKLLGLL